MPFCARPACEAPTPLEIGWVLDGFGLETLGNGGREALMMPGSHGGTNDAINKEALVAEAHVQLQFFKRLVEGGELQWTWQVKYIQKSSEDGRNRCDSFSEEGS